MRQVGSSGNSTRSFYGGAKAQRLYQTRFVFLRKILHL